MLQRIEVPATWESIEHLMAFTDDAEHTLALSAEQGFILRLVVEEIATNIVKYSYEPGRPGVIQIACSRENDALRIAIRDHGRPFDPRKAQVPEMGSDPTTRSPGGLGVFLVRELADDLSYTHDPASGWNELVVLKSQTQ